MKPQSIQACLGDDSALGALAERLSLLQAAESRLHRYLPEAARSHCRVMNLADGQLKIGVDSNAWSMQLRYLASDILSQLRQDRQFAGLVGVSFHVVPHERAQQYRAPVKARDLSDFDGARASLGALIEHVASPGLKAKLAQLARTFQLK